MIFFSKITILKQNIILSKHHYIFLYLTIIQEHANFSQCLQLDIQFGRKTDAEDAVDKVDIRNNDSKNDIVRDPAFCFLNSFPVSQLRAKDSTQNESEAWSEVIESDIRPILSLVLRF